MADNEVKRICAELGITQKELAERIGTTERSITDWSRGVTKTPQWAVELFSLLRVEQEHKRLKSLIAEIVEISTKK